MTNRNCKICNRILEWEEKALQSVYSGEWICVKCFEKKIGRKIDEKNK